MNGNELADVLRWGGEGEYQHEWYAGQELPKEWWKTDFPYREAEKMGYRLSPEETRRFQERTREKTLSEELADILKRPEVKMLDPLQRADLVDKIAKAQAAIQKREEEREKHEAEQLAIGRQTQMQEKVQAILQSDRVPAQKLTALTMIGVPVSDAQDMIWGKRVGKEEAGRPAREAAPRARAEPEELAAALRPEERGVQFRMVGGELIKEPAGIWEGRYTPEDRAEMRRAAEVKYEARRTEQIEAEKTERERMAGVYERRREAVRPPTRMEELEVEEKRITVKGAEEARLQAKFAPGELHRKALNVLDEAREAENAGIYERQRGNILAAMEKDLERADAEAAARKLLINEVDARGIEISAEKKAEEKERLEREREHWQGVRDNCKAACADELVKEEEKAKERQARIDLIDAKGEALKTAKEKKEQERLQKLQEKHETTRANIRKEMEKDEERKEAERIAKEERIKEVDELGKELADKRYTRKMEQIAYDDNKKKIERDYQDKIIEKGEKKAKDERDYKVKILDKTQNWIKLFRDMGFDNDDLVEIIPQFLRTLDVNKEQEEAILGTLGLMSDITEEREKEIVTDMRTGLQDQVSDLETRYKTEGLTTEIENIVEMVAYLQLALDAKVTSKDKAVEKWESTLATGGWYFGRGENPFKSKKLQDLFRDKMKSVLTKAKTTDLMQLAAKVVGEQTEKEVSLILKKKPPKAVPEIEFPEAFKTVLASCGDKETEDIMDCYSSIFNAKTGALSEPAATDRRRAIEFVIGVEDYDGPIEELPVNFTDVEYVQAIRKQPRLSQKQKGWLFLHRFNPELWEGMEKEAAVFGHLIMGGDQVKTQGIFDRFIGTVREKVTGWWPFGKEKKTPATVDFPGTKIYVDTLYERTKSMAEVERYLKEDVGITLDEYKEWLRTR